MQKVVRTLLVFCCIIMVVSACGQAKNASPDTGGAAANGGDVNGADNNSGQQDEAGSEQIAIKVYYTDDNLTDLIEKEANVSFKEPVGKYEAALQALKSSPDGKLTALWSGIDIRSVAFENGALTMDIHIPDEARLGAPGESLMLEAVRQTLFQFPEVQSIEILVDGQKIESLMGHVDLPHPMLRETN